MDVAKVNSILKKCLPLWVGSTNSRQKVRGRNQNASSGLSLYNNGILYFLKKYFTFNNACNSAVEKSVYNTEN
jgi:hypothetical protein